MTLLIFSRLCNDKGGRSEKLYMSYVYFSVILDIFLCYIWQRYMDKIYGYMAIVYVSRRGRTLVIYILL